MCTQLTRRHKTHTVPVRRNAPSILRFIAFDHSSGIKCKTWGNSSASFLSNIFRYDGASARSHRLLCFTRSQKAIPLNMKLRPERIFRKGIFKPLAIRKFRFSSNNSLSLFLFLSHSPTPTRGINDAFFSPFVRPLGAAAVLLPNSVPQPQAVLWHQGQPRRLQSSQKWVTFSTKHFLHARSPTNPAPPCHSRGAC